MINLRILNLKRNNSAQDPTENILAVFDPREVEETRSFLFFFEKQGRNKAWYQKKFPCFPLNYIKILPCFLISPYFSLFSPKILHFPPFFPIFLHFPYISVFFLASLGKMSLSYEKSPRKTGKK